MPPPKAQLDWECKPSEMRGYGQGLIDQFAPAYSTKSGHVREAGKIEPLGFGIALSWLKALYDQRVDFLAKDLQGAHNVCAELGSRLNLVADAYDRAENLNIKGFNGNPQPMKSFGQAYIGTHFQKTEEGSNLGITVGSGVTLGLVTLAIGTMYGCAAMCPTFVVGAILASGFLCNPLDIFLAGSHLSSEGKNLNSKLNVAFDKQCAGAGVGWTGDAKRNFVTTTTWIKGHLDQVGDYAKALGDALLVLDLALGGLWAVILSMVGPYLVWLIAMRVAEAFPLDIPIIESLIEVSGGAMDAAMTTVIGVCTAAVAEIAAVMTALSSKALDISTLPDGGTKGTPDLTEFSVGTNFRLPPNWLTE